VNRQVQGPFRRARDSTGNPSLKNHFNIGETYKFRGHFPQKNKHKKQNKKTKDIYKYAITKPLLQKAWNSHLIATGQLICSTHCKPA
jgi:hypothetical protein